MIRRGVSACRFGRVAGHSGRASTTSAPLNHSRQVPSSRVAAVFCLGSQVFVGQAVGIKEVHDDIWLVSFMVMILGQFDLEMRVLEPLENPFGPKVLPM